MYGTRPKITAYGGQLGGCHVAGAADAARHGPVELVRRAGREGCPRTEDSHEDRRTTYCDRAAPARLDLGADRQGAGREPVHRAPLGEGRGRPAAAARARPFVVEGEVVDVPEIAAYPTALTPLGGCTNFIGHYGVDPGEIAAIHRRTERALRRRWWQR